MKADFDDDNDFLIHDHDDDEGDDFEDRICNSDATIAFRDSYDSNSFRKKKEGSLILKAQSRKKKEESLILKAQSSIENFLSWKKENMEESMSAPEHKSWISFSRDLDTLHEWYDERNSNNAIRWCLIFSLVAMLVVFGIVELVNMNSDSDILSFFQNEKKDMTLLDSIQSLHSHENSKTSVNGHSGTDENVTLGSNILAGTVASAAAAATTAMSSVIDVMVQTEMTMVTMNKTMGGESSLPSSLVEPEDERINIVTKTCAITNIMFGGDGYRDCRDLCLEVGCCVVHVDDGEERLDCEIANDDVMSACVPYLSCANINDVRPPSLP